MEQSRASVSRSDFLPREVNLHALLHAVLDSIDRSVALLDADGTILDVNRDWRRFADANGLKLANYCVGVNYLSVCAAATAPDDETAQTVASGLRAIAVGTRRIFSCEYACHSPQEQRWFVLYAVRLELNTPRIIIFHRNVTESRLMQLNIQERFRKLTDREIVVLEFIIQGMASKNIAAALGISKRTIDVHRAHIMFKTGAENVAELSRLATLARIVPSAEVR